MRLSLYEFATGVATIGGERVVYDIANDVAHYGAATVAAHALVWQVDDTEEEAEGALVSRRIQLDPFARWIVRCDRIDFPPGGIAYTHTHPDRESATSSTAASTLQPRAERRRTDRVVHGSSPGRTPSWQRRHSTFRQRSFAC